MAKRVIDPEKARRRILKQALQAFRNKFGRDPLPGEPVFFDETIDVPTPISEEDLTAGIMELLSELPPQFTYAYEKTGLLLLLEDQAEHYPPDARAEWEAAIEEYFVNEALKEAIPTSGPDAERFKYMQEHPGFTGSLESDVSIEVLGTVFKTRLRADYVHTPDDEYYDLHSRCLRQGWLSTSVALYIKRLPEPDDEGDEPEWIKLEDLTNALPESIWTTVFDKVEDECKAEDARRRLQFLQPGGNA